MGKRKPIAELQQDLEDLEEVLDMCIDHVESLIEDCDRFLMREVREAHGIDVDACDDAYEQRAADIMKRLLH